MRATDGTYSSIDSIQVNNISLTSVEIDKQGFEVGIKTSEQVPLKAKLVKIDNFIQNKSEKTIEANTIAVKQSDLSLDSIKPTSI